MDPMWSLKMLKKRLSLPEQSITRILYNEGCKGWISINPREEQQWQLVQNELQRSTQGAPQGMQYGQEEI